MACEVARVSNGEGAEVDKEERATEIGSVGGVLGKIMMTRFEVGATEVVGSRIALRVMTQ